MRVLVLILGLSVSAHAQDGGWAPTRALLDGRTERLTLSRAVPMFGVVAERSDDGGVSHTLVLERGLLDEVGFTTSVDTEVSLHRLRAPSRVAVEVTLRAGGVGVRGAAVERFTLPPRPYSMRGPTRSLSLKLLRPDVLMLTDLDGGSCPTTDVVRYLLLKDGAVRTLLTTTLSGDAGFWKGTRAFWAGRAGQPTELAGFPKLELSARAPPSEQVTTIEQVVEDERVSCATRRRYRFTGDALQLLDVTHARDAGCPAAGPSSQRP